MTAPNYFVPNEVIITNIGVGTANGLPVIILLTTHQNYQSGIVVRFVVPKEKGMKQLDGQIAALVVLNNTTVAAFIDASQYDFFRTSALPIKDQKVLAQIVPIGETSNILSRTFLENLEMAVQNNNNIIPEILGPLPLSIQYQVQNR